MVNQFMIPAGHPQHSTSFTFRIKVFGQSWKAKHFFSQSCFDMRVINIMLDMSGVSYARL